MEKSFYVGIGIGIFLVIAFMNTQNGLQINQRDFIFEKLSDDQKEDSFTVKTNELMKKLEGKSFENLSLTLSKRTLEAILV